MTRMDGKKDPGKFTVRFNLCDPQQRQAAELINQQGRSKAQFISNAVLRYAGGPATAPKGTPAIDSEQLRCLIEDILVQWKGQAQEKMSFVPEAPADGGILNEPERSMILKTLDAFQEQ